MLTGQMATIQIKPSSTQLSRYLQELYFYADKETLEFCDEFLPDDMTTAAVHMSIDLKGETIPANQDISVTLTITDVAEEKCNKIKTYFHLSYVFAVGGTTFATGQGKRVLQSRDYYNKKGRSFL